MIRHHVQRNAGKAVQYYQLADYLAEGQVLRPELGGRAAVLLGVAGSNAKEHFERLCHNQHPLTGEQLTERMREDRIVGIDLTFDGPKSFSVLEALTPDPALAEARRAAALETMQEMERAAATRVRKGGKEENRTTANLVWYRAEHETSRPVDGVPDMQPHEHYFVLNSTWDPVEKQWKAANLYDVIRDMPYYQAAFHQRLARRLERLGYDVVRQGNCFEVAGVPRSVNEKFSRRQQIIEKEAEKRGVTDPDAKAELGAATREKKAEGFTPEQLRRLWAEKLSGAEQQAIAELHWRAKRRQSEGYSPPQRITPQQALEHAAAHLFERKSSAPARELLAHCLAFGVGQFDVADAWKHLESADRFTADVDGRLYVASRAVLREERGLVKLAADGKAALPAINPGWEIRNAKLELDQRGAVHHLLGSQSFVTMLIGAAGSGKTTALAEAKAGAEAAGVRVFAFAPSAQASRTNLAGEGFPDATTVAMLLADERLQRRLRGQVLLIDEAAMLGTKETAAVFRLAKEQGARVWLVGDDRQNRAVTRGAPFELLQKEAGITPAKLVKVRRQRKPAFKQVAELERAHPGRGLEKLQAMGYVKEVPDAERYRLLAADYLEAVKPARRKVRGKWQEVEPTALVISPTHAEGAKVTAEIRLLLKEQGKLTGEREFLQLTNLHLTEAERKDPHAYQPGMVLQFVQNAPGHRRGERVELAEGQEAPVHLAARFQAFKPGTIRLAAGDRVRITLGGKTKDGRRLNNGDLITVAKFTAAGDIVDDRGWVIPKDYGFLSHGYVSTSMSAQSRTVDRALVALGPESLAATNRRQSYVDLTRSREWVRVYAESLEDVVRAAQRDDAQISATEIAKLRKQRRELGLFARRLLLRRREASEQAPEAQIIDSQRRQQLQRSVSLER